MEKRNNKWWNRLKYKDSLDYYLASLLKKYKFNPSEAVVWFYNKDMNIIIFQYNFKYYKIQNNVLNEIQEEDIWNKKGNSL